MRGQICDFYVNINRGVSRYQEQQVNYANGKFVRYILLRVQLPSEGDHTCVCVIRVGIERKGNG